MYSPSLTSEGIQNVNAERLMLLGGLVSFVLTLHWVRSRDLRENYGIIWIGVSFILLVFGLFPNLIMSFADACRLSYPAAVLFLSLVVVYCYSFTLTVSLSRLYWRNARLTQEIGLLEHRIRELESDLVVKHTEKTVEFVQDRSEHVSTVCENE
jgi:hypothetical protein